MSTTYLVMLLDRWHNQETVCLWALIGLIGFRCGVKEPWLTENCWQWVTRVTTFIEDFKKAGCVSNDHAGWQEDHKFKASLHSETVSKTNKIEYEEMFGFGSLWSLLRWTHGSQATEGLLEHTLLASQTFRLGRPWVGSLMCTGFPGWLVTMLKCTGN